jgi:hypothetical protein
MHYAPNTPSGDVFKMSFADPTYDSNYCDISNPNRARFNVSFFAKSGDDGEQNNACPKGGHPVTVYFYITSFV